MILQNKKFDLQLKKIPEKVVWCKKCVVSNQRPRLIIDSDGVCSACNNVVHKKNTNWEERKNELLKLLDEYRSNNNSWDVIVPSSGGKDSGFVAHKLKYEFGMNPLLVTWSPLEYTNIGLKNFNSLNDNGFINLKCTPNGIINKKLARLSFEELGDAFHVFVLGQTYFPIHMALKMNIKLIFYGENGELEYSGDPYKADIPFKDLVEDKNWYQAYLKGTTLSDLIKFSIDEKDYINDSILYDSDLFFYTAPDIKEMIRKNIRKIHYFSYYHKWNPQENYYYCVENTGFKPNPERIEGTYSKYASIDDKMDGFHYYMRYIKFGLGRCMEDAAHEIRDGHITREEGIALMKKYEGEFPKKYFKDFLEYLQISEDDFWNIVDSWRSEHLWKKKNNEWVLKSPIT